MDEHEIELVTVVIPCYNQSRFLGEAIQSVQKQTYPSYEIIVVNDGSTDDTAKVAKKFCNIRLIEQNNHGQSAARNAGLQAGKGNFIVFLDSDDRLLPDALQIGVESLKNHPQCAFASGFCELISVDGSQIATVQPQIHESDYYQAMLEKCFIWSPGNVLFRRSILEQVAGFDTTLEHIADYELYLRIAQRYPVYLHGEIVAQYRQHSENLSNNHALMLKNTLSVLDNQREYVENNPSYKKSWQNGIAFYKQFYGERIGERLINSLKNRKWRQAASDALTLMGNPKLLPKYILRKLPFQAGRKPSNL